MIEEALIKWFRKHLNITLSNMYYHTKKKIYKKESTVPHWVVNRKENKKVAVIFANTDGGWGVASIAKQIIHLAIWCKRKDYPLYIFDHPFYSNENYLEEENVWSAVMEQDITLGKIYGGGYNILLFKPGFVPLEREIAKDIESLYDNPAYNIVTDKNALHRLFDYGKLFMRPSCSIVESANQVWEKYGLSSKRVLGVIMREEFSYINHMGHISDKDEKKIIYLDHPNLPEPEYCVDIAAKYMKNWKCDVIFLSTLFSDTINLFTDKFGQDKVVFVDRIRRVYRDDISDLSKAFARRPNSFDIFEIREKYIEEILLISKCSSLLSAPCGAAWLVGCFKSDYFDHLEYLPDLRAK